MHRAGTRCENWTQEPPQHLLRRRRRGPARHGARPALGAPALRRGEPIPDDVEVLLLAVPDGKIAEAVAAAMPDGPAARPLLRRDRPGRVQRPRGLQPAPDDVDAARSGPEHPPRRGRARWTAPSDHALDIAFALAERLGLTSRASPAEDRVAYHAAGAIAANFLVALEACAERLAATAGITRAATRAARPRHRPPVGRARPRSGADRRDRPRRRGHGRAPSRHDRAAHARAAPVWDELAEVTRAVAGRRGWA